MPGRTLTHPSAASLATILVAFALTGCSGNDGDPPPGLRITREYGSVVEIDRTLRAWCGLPRFQGDAGTSLHVLEGDRAFADPDDVHVNDVERDNEAAAYKEESLGSIEVERWGCDEGDVVTLTVDTRIASEIGGEALRARGTVTAEIGAEPEGYSG